MDIIDSVREALIEYSIPATVTDNGRKMEGRLVNLASLPSNIQDLLKDFLGSFNTDKMQFMFISDDGQFTFLKDSEILPSAPAEDKTDHDGIVPFFFVIPKKESITDKISEFWKENGYGIHESN